MRQICVGEAAVPEDSAAQTFVEVYLGFVAEGGASSRDIGKRVGNVSGARGCVVDGAGVSGELAQAFDRIVKCDLLAGSDVEDAAGNFFRRSGHGAQVGVHHIIDEGEVAALGSVAIDDGSAATEHGERELGEDAGVLRGRVLIRTKDIEVSDDYRFQSEDAGEAAHVLLASEFADRVGRDRIGHHAFVLGQRGLVAITRGGASVDYAAGTGIAGGDQQIKGAVHIGGVAGYWVLDRARNTGEGGLVEDELDAIAGAGACIGVFDCALDEVDAC